MQTNAQEIINTVNSLPHWTQDVSWRTRDSQKRSRTSFACCIYENLRPVSRSSICLENPSWKTLFFVHLDWTWSSFSSVFLSVWNEWRALPGITFNNFQKFISDDLNPFLPRGGVKLTPSNPPLLFTRSLWNI